MSTLENNVVMFNSDNNKNVYDYISTFLNRLGQESKNTKETYERHIRDFFRTMRNKEIEDLIESDLIFTKHQIESYQLALKEKYKSSTVNNTMSSLKKCYEKLEDAFDVEARWFNVDRYREYDKESYDMLSHDEIIKIMELIKTTRKGKEKALLIRVAYATAFRKTSLMELRWGDIYNRNGIWYMKTLGKGKKWSHKKITDSLYQELMNHKQNEEKRRNINLGENDYVFQLTKKTINRMMRHIRENMDFGDRNIAFHSIKKASLNEVNLITGGDLKAIQQQGDHSSVTTTLNDYIKNKDLDEMVTVDIERELPLNIFDEMNKDELITLIKAMDRDTQIKLLRKLNILQ